MKNFLLLLSCACFIFSCASQAPDTPVETQIAWDSWGVPHITSATEEELFYAQGWAQMHNHANLILELYGSSRGKGAEYWGQDFLENDIIIHTLGIPEMAVEWENSSSAETTKLVEAFTEGMNAYINDHPEAIDEKNRQVLPVRPTDIITHQMYVVFTRFVGGNELGTIEQWPEMGSNTHAVSPSRSASGKAMLIQNPHLPWWREFRFFESHFMIGDRNLYGSTLVGLPGIAIGFNNYLGWSHTDNTLDNADSYELELSDGGYLLDGERKEFESSTAILKIKQEDGSLTDYELPRISTVHGPVVKQTEDKVLALRLAGTKSSDMLGQWWAMINSRNLTEFETALNKAQIPFWNVMYADKEGNIMYVFNGLVPKRSEGDWDYWDRVIPDGKSSDIWTEYHSYADLPKLKNPENGWLQNANDPPWTSTIPTALNPDDYPAYMAPNYMSFRPQRSARILLDDESITFDELVGYKLSTRLEFADRILDDLDAAVKASDNEAAKEAMDVLNAWDRTADAESTGMLLFYNWARKFRAWDGSNYAIPWSFDNPNTTPDGLANPAGAVNQLAEAAGEIKAKYGTLEVPWGDYYRIVYNDKNLPANGSDGSLGVFRVLWPADGDEDHLYAGGGDSWVGVIEFGDDIKAKVLLSYGNATQEGSPHNGDQLELFSRKEMRVPSFLPEEVTADTKVLLTLTENGFVEKTME